MTFNIGLIVNPLAGLGGSVALKGSDGVAAEALARGAAPKAGMRCMQALEQLTGLDVCIYCWQGNMGSQWVEAVGLPCQMIGQAQHQPTTSQDTLAAARQLLAQQVDVIMFAGGDGTARDIHQAIQALQTNVPTIPVVGVPAGVKIHSGVYAISPKAAGQVIRQLVQGDLVSLRSNEVRDIDEAAFRAGTVKSKYFGELLVPEEHQYMQATKTSTGKEDIHLVLDDIADGIIEQMQDDTRYIMGSGSTVAAVMEALGIDNTLLGVDVIENGQLLAQDVTAQQLQNLCEESKAKNESIKLLITPIGGQGHLFGRGNQQLSPAVISLLGLENIMLIATKTKLNALQQRPFLVDTGDPALDDRLVGVIPVICGYKEQVLYRLGQAAT